MAFTLSLNTNPLVNRFAEADDLIDTIAEKIRIGHVQLTHEFVNPGWPAATINKTLRQFRTALGRTGVKITSGMTGPYGRLNHSDIPTRTSGAIMSTGSRPSPISPPSSALPAWVRNSRSSRSGIITTLRVGKN